MTNKSLNPSHLKYSMTPSGEIQTNFKRHFDEIVKNEAMEALLQKSENYYLSIKRINEIDQPFIVDISGQSVVYIDNGYYIVEFTPLEQFYNVRVFLDDDKKDSLQKEYSEWRVVAREQLLRYRNGEISSAEFMNWIEEHK